MRNGTPVRTPIGNSTRTGTLLYRVTGIDGSLGPEAWFRAELLERV